MWLDASMLPLAYIHITIDPIIVQFGGFAIHWYGAHHGRRRPSSAHGSSPGS